MLANPCPVLNIPANGALVCNNWKTDYGQICILFCENSYTVSRGVDADDFYICGASGSWTPKNTMPDCSGKLQTFNIQINLKLHTSKKKTISVDMPWTCNCFLKYNVCILKLRSKYNIIIFCWYLKHCWSICQSYGGNYLCITTDLSHVTDKLYYVRLYRTHLSKGENQTHNWTV